MIKAADQNLSNYLQLIS